ncbi:hypothetical protein UFOVP783_40 [uncultured Caudovirales phage]|uniref:Uncharacterized protein n=1 Tax=uncultured Caudovirales phage TaxID=2100421 RepID=A0A6J5NXL2_9CAUD|nr:hypothetical protein UFOVP783_40 [uncultured Caudovirales phage]
MNAPDKFPIVLTVCRGEDVVLRITQGEDGAPSFAGSPLLVEEALTLAAALLAVYANAVPVAG